jgi:hypothetical protein
MIAGEIGFGMGRFLFLSLIIIWVGVILSIALVRVKTVSILSSFVYNLILFLYALWASIGPFILFAFIC